MSLLRPLGRLVVASVAVGSLLFASPRLGAAPDFEVEPPSELELVVLEPAVRAVVEEAMAAERGGSLDKAAARYRLVLHRDPTVVVAVLGLARVSWLAGDLEGADLALASMPHEAELVRVRARLLEERDPETALLLYERLETLAIGSAETYLRQALLLADSDPTAAHDALSTWWELAGVVPAEDALVAVVVGLMAAGDLDRAQALLERAFEALPAEDRSEPLDSLANRIGVEREALRLAVGGTVPLTEKQRTELDRARRLFTGGDLEEALELLRDLVSRAPRSPEVWATLGDVHLARGAVAEAERAYVASTALGPDEARNHARLGTLLAERYGGRRHREAISELGTALALRGTWAELHYRLAEVQREAGRFEDAADSLRAYLKLEPEGGHAADAQQRLEDLERRRPLASSDLALAAASDEVPDPARHAYRIARVYRARGQSSQARAEVERALVLAPDYLDALLLLAALELEAGDDEAAARTYQRCLDANPGDPGLLLALGELRRSAGDELRAAEHFEAAARAGAPEAWYHLADMASERGRLLEARRHLEAYFGASTGGLAHEPAQALRARIERTLGLYRAIGGAATLLLLLAALALWVRRNGGHDLRTLLEREPASYHEVARLLSAIRHEVLKHNTNLLLTVAERLERGEPNAALYAAERLYGDGGESGVIRAFEDYVRELEGVGRRCGLRLNLRVRDPVIAPMHRAMRRLRRLEGAMRRPHRASPRLPRELRGLSEQLNEVGYRALGELIRDVSLLEVRGELFERVYQRVAAEPTLAGEAPPRLELSAGELAVPVRIFRKDLEDIATNLLRNAIFALMDERPLPERRLGVALVEEMDPVTGHETLAIRFLDNAPRSLTDAILRGSRIERGLGLAADLLARHQGVMNVEELPGELAEGWAKAVVVRLPRAETGQEGT